MERFGRMDYDRREYVVLTPATTKSQENFLFNDRYFAVANQCGTGFSRYGDPSGLYTDIIEGGYEPAFQHNTRLLYLRDDDTSEFWNVGYYPVCRQPDRFETRHGAGYTTITSLTSDIEATWRLFVPPSNDPVALGQGLVAATLPRHEV